MPPALSAVTQPRGQRRPPRNRLASVAISEVPVGSRPLARLFRALADETRIRILAWLSHGELCVCHLERALELSQPNVSRQLAVLRAAGIVKSRRNGTWVYYAIAAQEHPDAAVMLGALVKSFGAERMIRVEHPKLRRACGPEACK